MTYDKNEPRFWYNIRRGAFLDLSDEETLQESLEDGQGVGAVSFEVIEDPKTVTIGDICEFIIFNLQSKGKTDLMLVALIVDGDVELKAYFEDPNILSGDDRESHLERGDFWLFEEPEDVDDFDPQELEFANRIEFDDTTYEKKRLGTMHGIWDGDDEMAASVAEYDLTEASEETTNSELMILEYGHVETEQSYLALYFGYVINLSEVDVLQ